MQGVVDWTISPVVLLSLHPHPCQSPCGRHCPTPLGFPIDFGLTQWYISSSDTEKFEICLSGQECPLSDPCHHLEMNTTLLVQEEGKSPKKHETEPHQATCKLMRLRSYTAGAKSLQSYPALCDPMDCNSPGFSIHGILQARILERVAMPSSRGSSWLRDQTHIS